MDPWEFSHPIAGTAPADGLSAVRESWFGQTLGERGLLSSGPGIGIHGAPGVSEVLASKLVDFLA
jgi:hypothetical protein